MLSDGSEPAGSVAERAQQRGVEIFCLTDHDSCAGYPETTGSCATVLRGLEIADAEIGISYNARVPVPG